MSPGRNNLLIGWPDNMRLIVFASGSTGNCALVQGGGKSVLLDAGISARRIRVALEGEGVDPASLAGIFITHEHTDHVSGLPNFIKECPLPVYVPGAAANELRQTYPWVRPRIQTLELEKPLSLGGMTITPFPTPHDAVQSVGYRFEADASVLVTATDTGCVTNTMLRYFSHADAALIEANHDVHILQNSLYPTSLKRRILSDKGHLSNAESAWLAAVLADQGTGQIVLGHLSKNTNMPGLARRTVGRSLEGKNTQLHIAPDFGRLEVDVTPCFV